MEIYRKFYGKIYSSKKQRKIINNKGSEKQIQPGRYCNTKDEGPGSPDQKEFLSKHTGQNFKAKITCFAYRWQDRSELEKKLDTSQAMKGGRGK
jgi:hypothetical protein